MCLKVRANECKTRFLNSEVNFKFLRSLRHVNCRAAFFVIVLLLNKFVHGFKSIRNRWVKTGFQIARLWRLPIVSYQKAWFSILWLFGRWRVGCFQNCNLPLILQILMLASDFVKELSVLSGKSCADSLQNNSFLNDSIVKWLLLVSRKKLPWIFSSYHL